MSCAFNSTNQELKIYFCKLQNVPKSNTWIFCVPATIYIALHWIYNYFYSIWASQVVLVVKSSPANAGEARHLGSISGLGRYPKVENSYSVQYSVLENPMDRGAWWATVHRISKSRTRLISHTHTHTHHLHYIRYK